MYWILIPASKRRKCIFKKSCSKHVYDITIEKGGAEGIKALNFRIKNCRPDFEIFKNPIDKKIQMILPSQQIVEEKYIATYLIENYNRRENDSRKSLK